MEQDQPTSPAESSPPADAPQGLWNRDFLILWLGLVQSALGNGFLAIGLVWLVLEKTGSPLAASVVLILEGLPELFGPLAGVLVDRSNKKRLMIGCDLIRGIFLVGLYVLYLQGLLHVYLLFAAAAFGGALNLFYGPSVRILIPGLVPDSRLPAANSALQLGSQAAMVLGTAVGGMVLATLGAPAALLIDGISFLVMSAVLLFVRFPPNLLASAGGTTARVLARELVAGLGYLRGAREILMMTVVVFGINLVLSPANVIFPVFSEQVLGAGVKGFGMLASALGIGLFVGGIAAGTIGDRLHYRWAILIGLGGMSVFLASLSLTSSVWLAVVLAGCLGSMALIIQVPLISHLQRAVPPSFQGRTFATMNSMVSLATPLGAAIFGQALELWSAALAFQIAAGGCVAVALLWWLFGVGRAAGAPAAEGETPEPAPE